MTDLLAITINETSAYLSSLMYDLFTRHYALATPRVKNIETKHLGRQKNKEFPSPPMKDPSS
jgi:hypothetical protein